MAEQREIEYSPTPKRKFGLWKKLGLLGLGGLVLFVVFLPKLATNPIVLNSAVNRFGGIAPLQVTIDNASAGWWKPVSVDGIQLLDPQGQVLASVESVETEKGVWGWATNSSDLGKISVRGVKSAVVTGNGTSNLEQALEPLLAGLADAETEDDGGDASTSTVGAVEIVDSEFLMMEDGRPEQWLVTVSKMLVTLPHASQLIGPIDVQISIEDQSGTVPNSRGMLAAQVKQVEDADVVSGTGTPAFEIRAKMDAVPLEIYHVARARVPEIPISELQGRVSGVLAGMVQDESSWRVQVQDLKASTLSIVAPELVGEHPAKLQSVVGTANCAVENSMLTLDNTQITCDFATAVASAKIPWPIETPTAQSPFLHNAEFQTQGMVDLPKLVAAADTLIPLREDTRLLAGQVQFVVGQKNDTTGSPTSSAKLEFSGVSAVANGQPFQWQDPLSVEINAGETLAGVQMGATLSADFANVRGGGTIENGQLEGSVDLDTLRQRLSQFVELPITAMSGTATLDAGWNLQGDDVVVANGTLKTSPLAISTTAGGKLEEPAWNGSFGGRLKLVNSTPDSVLDAKVELNSRDEQLAFHLQEPLSLSSVTSAQESGTVAQSNAVNSSPPPAAFSLDVHADLARCNLRAAAWLSEPPELDVSGKLQLVASGRMDAEHVEIDSANWNGEPIKVVTSQMSFAEPKVVGKFKGRMDTSDITRTVVESLEMTSSSVSLIAQDEASSDGSGSRLGRARFLVDLGRLLQNASTGGQALASVSAPNLSSSLQGNTTQTAGSTQYSASGRCEGEMAWQINSAAAGVNLLINTSNLVVLSKGPTQIAATPLWSEPSLTTGIQGVWQSESSEVNISEMTFKTPWANYVGNCSYTFSDTTQSAKIRGQAVYDCGQLSAKLVPFTGGQINMAGQQTVPIEVDWTSGGDGNQAMLAGLNAKTRLGWQQANVAGIQVGTADVPISVNNGVLATAAEIPVSGGLLRWDIHSDLTADELVLNQKPATLLENVEITEEMCKGWLKYVTPLMAETTSVDGRLSLQVDQAILTPAAPEKQTVVGHLKIHRATVGPGPLSNSIISLVKQVEAIRKQDLTQAVSSTQKVWMDMPEQEIDYEMVNGRVIHRNLSVEIGDAKISTRGSVGVDGTMQMVAAMPIPDDWADKSPWLEGLRGQTLEFPMGGTVTNPQIDKQLLTQLGRQTVRNAAGGIIEQGINKGLDKLLGENAGALGGLLGGAGMNASGSGLGTAPNGVPAAGSEGASGQGVENPVMGIGEQILKGQGINLPGIFGGRSGN